MKPFDLEKALAGDKVVTRDGREVTQLHVFDIATPANNLFGVLDGKIMRYRDSGTYLNTQGSVNDLFMASTKHEEWGYRWLNEYDEMGAVSTCVFATELAAKVHATNYHPQDTSRVFVFKIREWEE